MVDLDIVLWVLVFGSMAGIIVFIRELVLYDKKHGGANNE